MSLAPKNPAHRRRIASWILFAGLAWSPCAALACSGPGAAAFIARNERIGLALLLVTLLYLGGLAATPRLRSGSLSKHWSFILLAVLHPGWWMSARAGDCGIMLVEGSLLVTFMAMIWGAVRFTSAKPKRP